MHKDFSLGLWHYYKDLERELFGRIRIAAMFCALVNHLLEAAHLQTAKLAMFSGKGHTGKNAALARSSVLDAEVH